MTIYRESVERQLMVCQTGLQIGLQKANEQELSITTVAETLSRTMWGYAIRMNARFEVTSIVDLGRVVFEHRFTTVKQALKERFEVEADGDVLTAESDRLPYGIAAYRVVFESVLWAEVHRLPWNMCSARWYRFWLLYHNIGRKTFQTAWKKPAKIVMNCSAGCIA